MTTVTYIPSPTSYSLTLFVAFGRESIRTNAKESERCGDGELRNKIVLLGYGGLYQTRSELRKALTCGYLQDNRGSRP